MIERFNMEINYFEKLAFANMSRILQHMKNPFGILSAHIGANSSTPEGRNQNNIMAGELKNTLKQNGLTWIELKGGWKDTFLNKLISEDSLFIVNVNQQTVAQYAKQFNQQAYIWGTEGKYTVFNTENSQSLQSGNIIDHIKVDAIEQTEGELDRSKPTARNEMMEQGFTEIGGKRFTLKDPNTAADAYSHYFFIFSNEDILGINRKSYGPVQVKTAGINDRLTTQYGGLLAVFIPLVEILPSAHTVHPSK